MRVTHLLTSPEIRAVVTGQLSFALMGVATHFPTVPIILVRVWQHSDLTNAYRLHKICHPKG